MESGSSVLMNCFMRSDPIGPSICLESARFLPLYDWDDGTDYGV